MNQDLTWFASAIAFAISMSGSPGPNNTMVAASGANWGFRRTLPHIAGISLGFPLMLILVAFGAGALLREQPWIHTLLRWTGAAYLAWLALRLATTRPGPATDPTATRPLTFLAAAAFQWINPKAWIIAIGAIVTFTTTGDALLTQALTIAALFVIITLAATSTWTLLGVGAGRLLHSPGARRGFNLTLAALLLASLLSLLINE